MTCIAFLGLGAMGTRMAQRLLDAGHTLQVWNRTSERAIPLTDAGAHWAATPREAVEGAKWVISMVRDDAASRWVWLDSTDGAIHGMAPGTLALECSTLSVTWVRELAGLLRDQGIEFLDAPLAGSRPQAEAGQLIFFVGGETQALTNATPILQVLGGAIHHAGPNGAGATVKLMVNALFGTQVALLAELIGFARYQGLAPEQALEIIATTPVCSPAAKLAAGAMLAGQWQPAFPIELVAKDFALLDESAQTASLPLSQATGEIYQAASQAGFADDNITGVVQRYQ